MTRMGESEIRPYCFRCEIITGMPLIIRRSIRTPLAFASSRPIHHLLPPHLGTCFIPPFIHYHYPYHYTAVLDFSPPFTKISPVVDPGFPSASSVRLLHEARCLPKASLRAPPDHALEIALGLFGKTQYDRSLQSHNLAK